MRPLKLNVEKFLGLESLSLDFESSFFVLVGPNGAGKSSILEAIFFALFGRGIRLERGKKELIHRGYPEGPLRVELEFLLGSNEFRVVREYSPRGGMAVLEKKEDSTWRGLASGEQLVNQKIEETLGFDYLTFKSSVFLPQGETLSFVEATPAERFRTLSSLFGLELLDLIRDRVKEELRSLERELLPEESKLEELEKESLEEQLRSAKEEINCLENKAGDLTQKEKEKEKRTGLLNKLIEIKNSEKELQKKHGDLEKNINIASQKAREDREIQKAWEVKASFWQPWQIVVEQVKNWEKEQKTWLEKKTKIEEEVTQLSQKLEEIKEGITERETKRNNLASYEDKLRWEALPLAEEARAIRKELQELNKNREETVKKIEQIEITLQKEEEAQKRLEEKITEEKEKIDIKEKLIERAEKAKEWVEPLLKELGEKDRELSLVGEELKSLQKEIMLSNKEYKKVEREWEKKKKELSLWQAEKKAKEENYHQVVKSFALWELEREWEEKGACPLCGNNVPPPQVRAFPEVDWEEYHSFQEQGVKLVEEESSLRQKKIQEETKITELKDKEKITSEKKKKLEEKKGNILDALKNIDLPPLVKPENLEEFLKEKRREREKAISNLYELEKSQEVKKTEIEGRKKERDREKERANTIKESISAKEQLLSEKREQLWQIFTLLRWKDDRLPEEAFSDLWDKFSKRLQALSEEVEKLRREESRTEEKIKILCKNKEEAEEKIAELLKQGEELREREGEKREAFQEELSRWGWSAEYFEQLRDKKVGNWQEIWHRLEGEIKQTENSLRDYQEKKTNLIHQLEIKEEEIEEQLMQEEKILEELHKELGEIREKKGSLDKDIENLQAKIEERDKLRKELQEKRKNRELHSQLDKALDARSFRSYLLGFLFRELEEEASFFLGDLSQGRYLLRMKMEEGKAEMVVVDNNYGGEERLPSECSGGEKTLVALSLALALSRIHLREVGKERGADCLFIDEGFSALDQEHLELVADAILRLSQDGRMVGIVTHDPSFARYFPLHLEVRGGKAFWRRNEEVI